MMSGDVQPRKRKDKRRKKDDEDTGTPPPTLISPSDTSTENINIHIYKESSTGGHWCARIIFFVLLAVLVGLIGIIIFEHRGTTDVDTPVESSRWASIFEGWVDDSPPGHDEPHEQEETSEEVLEEEKEEEKDEQKESVEAEKEEEEEGIEPDTEEDEGIGEEEEQEEEDYDGEDETEEGDEVDEETEEDNAEVDETVDEDESKEMDDEENDEGIDEGETNEEYDDVQQESDDTGILEEIDDTNEDEDASKEKDMPYNVELDASTEIIDNSAEERDNDISEEFVGIRGVNEIEDNNAEPLEEIEGEEAEEDINDADAEESEEEEEPEEETTSVAVKFGVGVALVVAAHFVLVRRWNNVEIDTSRSYDVNIVPDLSRRNTIVPPPHIKQVIKSAENVDNKVRAEVQVKSYEDLRSKYNNLQEENISLAKIEKTILQDKKMGGKDTRPIDKKEIHAARSQSKIISSEEEDEECDESEDEHILGTKEYEDEQEEEEDEEEEEEDDDDEDDEEIETIDDSELIAKLEAKYGKLPTPQNSEEDDEEEEEEEEEDEEEEECDEIPEWKRVKTRKDEGTESRVKGPVDEAEVQIKQANINQFKNGGKGHDFSNTSDFDDVIVYEENDSTVSQTDREFH